MKWLPEDSQLTLLRGRWEVKDNEIKLGNYKFWQGGNVEAYCCLGCHKIMIDYK